MSTKPSIVFAHGLWADGSCFSKVIDLLQADGFECIATQNQLNTVEDDVAAVRTSFNRVSSPIVLVGRLAFFRREGADVDEADHVAVARRGVADHRAAVGVADEHDRARDALEDAGNVL